LRPELAFVAIIDTGTSQRVDDGDWHNEALCREMDGDIFFLNGAAAPETREKYVRAVM
jgi:hypothetical protein